LSADIFGDWREELILRNTANDALNIFTTVIPTDYRVPTLMHDHVYRLGVAWQNVAYNQPPHLGYYLPDYIESFQGVAPTGITTLDAEQEVQNHCYYNLQGIRISVPSASSVPSVLPKGVYITNGKKIYVK
jgi:rhamnogalacturonan endolyase